MLIPNATFASIDQVAANLPDLIAAAAQGTTIVVLDEDANKPAAALVSLDDLRLIGEHHDQSADSEPNLIAAAAAVSFPALLQQTQPGSTPIGVYADSTPATIKIRGHHILMARDSDGRDQLIASALAGAMASTSPKDLGFVLVTPAGALGLPEELLASPAIVSCQSGVATDEQVTRFIGQFRAEIRARQEALRAFGVRSVAELRRGQASDTQGEPKLADLVVLLDRANELMSANSDLGALVSEVACAEEALGLYLWLVSPVPLNTIAMNSIPLPIPLMNLLPSRVALQTLSAAYSREAVGTTQAATISNSTIGFCKPDNLTPARKFHVCAPSSDQVAQIIERSGPRSMPAWAQSLPKSLDLAEAIAHWQAAGGQLNTATVPIGLVDDAKHHQIVPHSITFDTKLRALKITGSDTEHLTSAVEVIVLAAAQTNDTSTLRFIYVGPQPTGFRAMWLSDNVKTVRMDDTEALGEQVGELMKRLDEGGDDHIVLIIDGLKQWQQSTIGDGRRLRSSEVLDELARRGPAAGMHVIATTKDNYSYQLGGLVDDTIELRLAAAFQSELDKNLAAHIPDDPHHGLVSRGHLLLATVDA